MKLRGYTLAQWLRTPVPVRTSTLLAWTLVLAPWGSDLLRGTMLLAGVALGVWGWADHRWRHSGASTEDKIIEALTMATPDWMTASELHDACKVRWGSLYRALWRLEESGDVLCAWRWAPGGQPQRRIYRLLIPPVRPHPGA